MALNVSKGNMYDWVGPRRNFIGGTCPHQCKYCSVKSLMRFPNVKKRYTGKIRLLKDEFKKPPHSSKPIFVGSCFDMWAKEVDDGFILSVLYYLRKFDNQYVFQTKNPDRYKEFASLLHQSDLLGTTIETNRTQKESVVSVAPIVDDRAYGLWDMKKLNHKTFVTIEPIMDFDVEYLASYILYTQTDFVNIGADSKCHNLPEPSWQKVQELISELKKFTEVRCKSNLERLKP